MGGDEKLHYGQFIRGEGRLGARGEQTLRRLDLPVAPSGDGRTWRRQELDDNACCTGAALPCARV